MQATSKRTKRARRASRLTRGVVMVEYTMLITGVAMPAAAGIVAGGAQMLQEYHQARDMLLLPIP